MYGVMRLKATYNYDKTINNLRYVVCYRRLVQSFTLLARQRPDVLARPLYSGNPHNNRGVVDSCSVGGCKKEGRMKKGQIEICIIIVLLIFLTGFFVVFSAKKEAEQFNRFSKTKITWMDTLWADYRILPN